MVDEFYRKLAPNATYEDAVGVFLEEMAEAKEAALDVFGVCSPLCQCPDATEARAHLAKELADLLFTARGIARMAGIDLDDAFEIVATDNLTNKVLVESGKVRKKPNYFPPDLTYALTENRL